MAILSTTGPRTLTELRSLVAIMVLTTAMAILLMQIEGPAFGADGSYRTPAWAITLHLATVLPALLLGPVILARPKGGKAHSRLVIVWMGMLLTTAVASLWIRGDNGAFSGIHIFSIGTLIALPMAIWRVRMGDIGTHRQIMVSLYVGLIIAGAFALVPDRAFGQYIWRLLPFIEQQNLPDGGLVFFPIY